MVYMQRIKLYQLFFKCCHKIDANMKGYMFNGKYIECISQYCWQLYAKWTKDKSKKNTYNLIEIFADIKRKQSNNWKAFIFNPKMPIVPFKKEFRLIFTDVEPLEQCIGYHFNGEIFYETYEKIKN